MLVNSLKARSNSRQGESRVSRRARVAILGPSFASAFFFRERFFSTPTSTDAKAAKKDAHLSCALAGFSLSGALSQILQQFFAKGFSRTVQ
jgi:hypothetical protein